MAKLKIEKDIESTKQLLRFMTGGQGYAEINLFDAGAGGGFNDAHVNVNLERDGLILNQSVYTAEDLKILMLVAVKHMEIEDLHQTNERYKQWKWNEE